MDEVLVAVVEDVTRKLNTGQVVDVAHYASKHPAHAEQIRRLVPALKAIARLGDTDDGHAPVQETRGDQSLHTGVVGDFRIIKEIGRGGMGVVYEAEQMSLGRRVALKVLPFAAMLDGRQIKRFTNESRAAAMLHHQNIVPIYGVGCERGVHYYAMQYIEGQTLASVISDMRRIERHNATPEQRTAASSELAASLASGKLFANQENLAERTSVFTPVVETGTTVTSHHTELPDTRRQSLAVNSTKGSTKSTGYFRSLAELGTQIAEALDHAHAEGVIHRDIKPSNLMLEASGKVWVTDFGLARVESDPGLTLTGDIIGTLRYMSPEQALANRVVIDHRTDIYSLGVTLYELATLEPAFAGVNQQELLRQIAFEEPKSLRKRRRSIPEDLETIILKCMAKNPAERYSAVRDVASDLRCYLEDRPIKAKRPSVRTRLAKWYRRHKGLAASLASIATIAVIALAVISTLMLRYERGVNTRCVQVNQLINDAVSRTQHFLWQASADVLDQETHLASALRAAERARGLSQDSLATPSLVSRVRRLVADVDTQLMELRRRNRITREREIPAIQQCFADNHGVEAMKRSQAVAEVLPEDPDAKRLWDDYTVETSIESLPHGARFEIRDWDDVEGPWLELGVTPLLNVRLPLGPMHIRVSRKGRETLEQFLMMRDDSPLTYTLDLQSNVPDGMVRVPEGHASGSLAEHYLPMFLIDRYEVTNAQFQQFVDSGGYQSPHYWKYAFAEDGAELTFQQAMELFVDTTKANAPAAWADGKYPRGQADYPVAGISWFEAAAYSQFVKKKLPSIFHWRRAASGVARYIVSSSNIGSGNGPRPIGQRNALSRFGVCDAAGNVAEWCWNSTGDGRRYALGGCWNDPTYMLRSLTARSPWTRFQKIGFRCSIVGDEPSEDVYAAVDRDFHDYLGDDPISGDRFEAMMDILYRRDNSNTSIVTDLEGKDELDGLKVERWQICLQDDVEQLPLHVYTGANKPKAAVVYFPGGGCLARNTREEDFSQEIAVEFAKAGYAVCWPTYEGTYERRKDGVRSITIQEALRIAWAHEVGLAIRFLSERYPQMPIVYVGFSMGGVFGPQAVVTNPEFDAAIFLATGFPPRPKFQPKVSPLTFVPRVSIPTLIVNGNFDGVFPRDVSQDPFFELLGKEHHIKKKMKRFESGHGIPVKDSADFADTWLRGVLASSKDPPVGEPQRE